MRAVLAGLVAGTLLVTAAQAEPLAAGRPAGVHAARLDAWNTAMMIGTGAVILAGAGFLLSGRSAALSSEHFDSNAVPFQPPNNSTVTTGTN